MRRDKKLSRAKKMSKKDRRDYRKIIDIMRRIKKHCNWWEILNFCRDNLFRYSINSYLRVLIKARVIDMSNGLYSVKTKTRKPFLRVLKNHNAAKALFYYKLDGNVVIKQI